MGQHPPVPETIAAGASFAPGGPAAASPTPSIFVISKWYGNGSATRSAVFRGQASSSSLYMT